MPAAATLYPEDRELRDEDAAADAELRDAEPLAPVAEAPNFEESELRDEEAAADAELRDAAAWEPSDEALETTPEPAEPIEALPELA